MRSKDTDTETAVEIDNNQHHLRSSDPDLKVILGSGEDQVTKWYYATSLANKSKYIDTMLSTPMKESDTRTITFPDITQEFWEAAIEFVDNPVKARKMEPSDVLNVAKFYDKYEFVDGTNLCDCVLLDYFEHLKVEEKELSVDVDLLIDSVVSGVYSICHWILHIIKRCLQRIIWKRYCLQCFMNYLMRHFPMEDLYTIQDILIQIWMIQISQKSL